MSKTILLIILSLSIFASVTISSSAQVSIKLINPSDGSSDFLVNAGATFDVQVEVDTNGESINGYSIYISIDDSLLQAIDQDASFDGIQPFLQGDFLINGLSVENDTHNEPNGIDKFQLDYSELQLQGGRSGRGLAATLKFRAVADGATTINFDFDPQNNRVTWVSFPGGNVVQPTTVGATVTIGGSGMKQFVKVSGDNQTGSPNESLPAHYVVAVNEGSVPLSGQRVTFEVTSGGGNFNGSPSIVVYTNIAGLASATLTLGPNQGTNIATATLDDYSGGALTFTASATQLEGVDIHPVSGDNQKGRVGTTLSEPFVVSVADKFGEAAAKSPVTFQVTSGGGNISGSSSVVIPTNTKGEARATLTLGAVAGATNNRVKAYLANGDAVTFVATAEVGEADQLVKISGDGQTAEVSKQLSQPFVVRITDRFGNPIPEQRVTFTVTQGDGAINGAVRREKETGEDGMAAVTLKLGEEIGTVSVKATAHVNSGSPQIFTASASVGPAVRIYQESGDEQRGIVGQSLKYPLVVAVKDDFFNPVAGELVIFEVLQGGRFPSADTIMEVKTDSGGKASVTPILGTKPGDESNKFEAYLAYNPSISVTFTASSVEGEPQNLVIEGGDNQVGVVGEELGQPLALMLQDDFGNSIPGARLIFEVTLGDGRIREVNSSNPTQTKQWATTDENGRAAVKFTLGSSVSTQHRVNAYLRDDERVAVIFHASAIASEAAYLDVTSTGELSGVVDAPLDEPLVVIARDTYGNPVSGADVSFEVIEGGGTVGPNLIYGASATIRVKSGEDGRTIAWWTLGTLVGANIVHAQVDGVEGEPIIFTATAQPDTTEVTFNRITEGSHEGLQGIVGQPLENPLKVSVRDKFDNPVNNARVLFKVSLGGGKLAERENQPPSSGGSTELIVATDMNGEASVVFILGEKAGRDNHIATASVMEYVGLPTIFFTVSAEHDVPATIAKVGGDEQVAKVNQALPLPLTVVVQDRFDNPVRLAEVQFSVIDEAGFLSPLNEEGPGQPQGTATAISQTTDADGMAMVRYLHGTAAGENIPIVAVNMATMESPPPPVDFIASVQPDAPASLKLTSGDKQTGTVDTALEAPLEVTVGDRYNNPVMYTEVIFEVIKGGGALFPVYLASNDARERITTQTDQLGQAKAKLILGRQSGDHNNEVRVWIPEPNSANIEPLADAPVILFTASGQPATGVKLVKIGGDGQVGMAGQQLPVPLAVVLHDHLGNPVGGAPVLFEVIEGGGRLTGSSSDQSSSRSWAAKLEVKTDANGTAGAILKLGSLAGENNNLVRVWLAGREPFAVQFTASADAVTADELIKTSGDNQTGSPGLPLPAPFVVTLVDKYNNPISGGTVNFTVKVGSGMLRPDGIQGVGTRSVDITTDEKGQARATLILPTSAEHEHLIEVRSTLLPFAPPITFSAGAIPDATTNLNILSGDEQIGTVSKLLPEPLVVTAEDRFGNPVSGVEVNFEVIAGGGKLEGGIAPHLSVGGKFDQITVATDIFGKAAVKFILGPDVTVINQVKATLDGFDGFDTPSATQPKGFEVIFSARAKSASAAEFDIFAGDGQTHTVGQILPETLVVLVKDQFGNPAEGAQVNFKVILGHGGLVRDADVSAFAFSPTLATPLEQITVATDIFGQARVNLILGAKTGANNNVVLASPVGFYGPSLYFRASAEASTAHQLLVIAGDEQKGIAGALLNDPLIVTVTDVYENPVPSFPLYFAVTQADGLLEGGSIEEKKEEWVETKVLETGVDGRVAIRWMLGPVAGENRLEVRAGTLVGGPITFTAEAKVSSEIKLVKVSGDRQIGVVGGPLSQPLKVTVSDNLDNPIPEVEVSFFVESGSGKLNDNRRRLNFMTNENGMARANLTLGTKSGVENNLVSAAIISLPSQIWLEPPTDMGMPVIFKATAEADVPQNMFTSTGNNQLGIAGTVLLEPLVVTILDRFLNPVKDAVVIYAVKEGNGKLLLSMSNGEKVGLASLEAVTDNAGQAGVFFQLAKNMANGGVNRVIAYPADAPDLSAEFFLYTNRPPIFIAPVDESQEEHQPPSAYTKTIRENEFLLFTVAAVDPDGEELTILAEDLPLGSTFKKTNAYEVQWQFTWRPNFSQSGEYRVTFIAADAIGNTSRQTVSVIVGDNNRAPTMTAIPDKMIAEGETLSFRIEAADPDADAITYTAEGLPEFATLSPHTGEFSWQPSFKQAATYPITVYALDGFGGTTSQTFRITVTDVNIPPNLAAIGDKQAKEGEPLEFFVSAVDVDGDKLTFFSAGMPDGAILSPIIDGGDMGSKQSFSTASEDTSAAIFSWTPAVNQAGTYNVTVIVTDVKGEEDSQSFSITVEDVNFAPTFAGQDADRILLGREGENIQFELEVVDPEGGTVQLTATHLPRGATFETTVGQDSSLPFYPQDAAATIGRFDWTPDLTQAGNYEITFWAADNGGSSSSTVVKISVANVNRTPTILTDFSNTSISEGEEWTVLIEASDPDGEPLEYKVSPALEGASLLASRFSWRPNFRQAGFYQLQFTVIDPNGGSDTKVAALTVLDVNHQPTISVAKNHVVAEGEELSFAVTATDADDDKISFMARNLPAGAHFDTANQNASSAGNATPRALFRWIPSYQQSGVYNVTFTVTDNKSAQTVLEPASSEATVTIFVTDVNQPPQLRRQISGKLNGDNLTIDASEGLKIYEGDELTLTFDATDNDDDNLSYGAYNIPPGAVFNIYDTFLWKPNHTQEGTYYVRFIAFDGAASEYIDLKITVLDKNHPPQMNKIKDIRVEPGEEIRLQIAAIDVDGDKFEYSIANLPPGATFVATGTLRWTPLPMQTGVYKVTFIAKDAYGQSAQTVTIAVGTDGISPMSLPWDVNGDTVVDVTDLMMVGQHQGEESAPDDKNPSDVNGDGKVDLIDMVLVGMHFGETLPQASPELEGEGCRELVLSRSSNRLYQNYPNPFNPETWIPYHIAQASEVSISIYNSRGRLVKTLRLGFKPPGKYVDKHNAASWDGRNETGERVANGVYFYKIKAGRFEMVRKMVVLE